MIQRFALAVWPDDTKEWRLVDRYPNTVAKNNAQRLYERLARLDTHGAEQDTYPDGNADGLPYLRFDEDAQAMWDRWNCEIQKSARAEESVLMEGWTLKAPKFVASLALVFQLCERATISRIGTESLTRALGWHWYLQTHARRIYSRVLSPEIAAAVALDEKIKARKIGSGFSPRDAYMKGWAGLDRVNVDKAVNLLAELDRVRIVTVEATTAGGRPTQKIEVNPHIFGERTEATPRNPPARKVQIDALADF